MTTMTTTEAIRNALSQALTADASVFVMGEDIGSYGGAFGVTRGLLETFGPKRIRDTPISEATLVGAGIGAAMAGSRPVVEIMFMDFITLALDQLINQAAKLHYVFGDQARCPIVIRTPNGGGRGYGATHSQCLESLLFSVPGLKICAPSSPAEAAGLLLTAIADDNPVIFLEHKLLYPQRGPVADPPFAPIPFGQARVVREGADVTIVAWSYMTSLALHAATELLQQDIEAEVIDLRTLCPLDIDTICESVEQTGRLLIVEEGHRTGGISGEIGFRVFERAYDLLDGPIRRVTAEDCPIPAARELEKVLLPSTEKIVAACVAMVEETA